MGRVETIRVIRGEILGDLAARIIACDEALAVKINAESPQGEVRLSVIDRGGDDQLLTSSHIRPHFAEWRLKPGESSEKSSLDVIASHIVGQVAAHERRCAAALPL